MIKEKTKMTKKECVKKIGELREIAELNIVTSLWKSPQLYLTYDELTIDSFALNKSKVFYEIGKDITVKEGKQLDELTVDLYLEKHSKLAEKYIEYGSHDMFKALDYVNDDNMGSYVEELLKYNVLIQMMKEGFPVAERFSDYMDLNLEEIYMEQEALLNHLFANRKGKVKSYKIGYNIEQLIDDLDEGLAVGLSLHNLPMITDLIGGNIEGNITLCGGTSGTGKSTFSRSSILPSIIKEGEKIVVMVNEESIKKWQRELIIWVANNLFKKEIPKYKLRKGGFDPEFKKWLIDYPCRWIKEHENSIIIVPFSQYNTSDAIKTIKKYIGLGVKYYILDTFKADSDGDNSTDPKIMQQNMVKIYDTIKEETGNVHIWVTFQLNKASSKMRYYTMDNVGMAKNIIDVASTCLMIRNLYEDEFDGGKNALTVFKKTKNGSKVPVKLDRDKHYQVVFIVKNREGGSNDYQIVIEHDMSMNIIREIGMTYVPVDF